MKVPRSALSVADHQSECFAEAEGENAKARFTMIANSGGVIPNHPHWGNFAIDFDGLKIAKQKLPALRDHSSQRIVGHTEKIQVTDQGLVAEGVFANTPDGNEVSAMLAEGYPWQASVYVPPKKIERLEEGETAEVNGHHIEGPGHIFRESHLREVTFTSLGADENTSAAVLSDHQVTIAVFTAQPEEVAMSEPIESVEASAELSDPAETESESAFNVRYEEAIQEERDRVLALLNAATKDQSEVVSGLIQAGVSLNDGMSALLSDLKDRAEERLSHALNTTPEPVGPMTDEPSDPRSAFESDKDLVSEFGSFEVYEAFTKAQDAGAIRGKV